MGDVRNRFLKPLATQFAMPRGLAGAPEDFFAPYVEHLSAYPDDVLEKAAAWLMENSKFRTFPTIADCRACCRSQRMDDAPRVASASGSRTFPDVAENALATPHARRALDLNCLIEFHEFAMTNGVVPQTDEQFRHLVQKAGRWAAHIDRALDRGGAIGAHIGQQFNEARIAKTENLIARMPR